MRGVTENATEIKDPAATEKALTFFKIMAFIVGVGLLLLVLEVILHYGFDNEALSWWPQPHGFFYLLYVVSTANLGFKLRWSLSRMVLVMLAGVVPFLSFWAERKVATQVEAQLAEARR